MSEWVFRLINDLEDTVNQDTFLKPMQRLGYQVDQQGMCLGYGHMAAQALLAGEFDVFMERMQFIAQTQVNELIHGINTLKTNPDKNEANNYVDVLAFFEGVAIYQEQGKQYSVLFPNKQAPSLQEGIALRSAILAPVSFKAEAAQMSRVNGFTGVYDENELVNYLHSLQETVANLSTQDAPSYPVVVEVQANNHATCLSYNPNNKEHPWIFIDPNYPEDIYGNVEEIAKKMHRAFDKDKQIILSTNLLCTVKKNEPYEGSNESRVHALLEKWESHPVIESILTVTDEKMRVRYNNLSWLETEILMTGNEKNIENLLNNASLEQREDIMACVLRMGDRRLAESLIKDKGVDAVNWKGHADSALMFLSLNAKNDRNATALIQLFLDYNVKADVVDQHGENALFNAAKQGYHDAMDLLIKNGADFKQINKEGESLLFVAAKNGRDEMVGKLLDLGLPINKANAEWKTPLLVAAENYHPDAIRLLVERGADIDVMDKNENNVLQHVLAGAIKNGDLNIIHFLISQGADIYGIKKTNGNEDLLLKGQRLLSLAIEQNQTETIKALVLFGVKVDEKNIALCKTDAVKEIVIQTYVKSNDHIPEAAKEVAVKAFSTLNYIKEGMKHLNNQDDIVRDMQASIQQLESAMSCMLSMNNTDAHARIFTATTDLMAQMESLPAATKGPSWGQLTEWVQKTQQEVDAWEENAVDYSVDGVKNYLVDFMQVMHDEYNHLMLLPEQLQADAVAATQDKLQMMKEDFSSYIQACFDMNEDDLDEFIMSLIAEDESLPVLLYAITEKKELVDAARFGDLDNPCAIQVERGAEARVLSVYPLHVAVMLNNEKALSLFVEQKINVNLQSKDVKTQEGKLAMPLSIAEINKHEKIIETLVKQGAKVETEKKEEDHRASVSLAR